MMKKRKEIFINNLIDLRKKYNSGKHFVGINIFADRLKVELPPLTNNKINDPSILDKFKHLKLDYSNLKQVVEIPDNYFSCDENGDDLCGKTVHQGDCGSCYACSIANNMQIQYSFLTKKMGHISKEVFSAQQVIDCYQMPFDSEDLDAQLENPYHKDGCSGGIPLIGLLSVDKFALNSSYPYEDYYTWSSKIYDDGSYQDICTELQIKDSNCSELWYEISLHNLKECRQDNYNKYIGHNVDNLRVFYNYNWETIKYVIYTYKSFIAGIYANDDLQLLSDKSIFECDIIDSHLHSPDHAVVVDGYGEEKVGDETIRYLWVRNSWGDYHGGYGNAHFKLNFDPDKSCGLNSYYVDASGQQINEPSYIVDPYLIHDVFPVDIDDEESEEESSSIGLIIGIIALILIMI